MEVSAIVLAGEQNAIYTLARPFAGGLIDADQPFPHSCLNHFLAFRVESTGFSSYIIPSHPATHYSRLPSYRSRTWKLR